MKWHLSSIIISLGKIFFLIVSKKMIRSLLIHYYESYNNRTIHDFSMILLIGWVIWFYNVAVLVLIFFLYNLSVMENMPTNLCSKPVENILVNMLSCQNYFLILISLDLRTAYFFCWKNLLMTNSKIFCSHLMR